jgi:glycosyltransferase involved in cell wall biosynthesis
MQAEQPFSIVCLSSQTWDTPLPTNRQQIMSRAAQRGHPVLFVETGDFVGKHLWRLVRGPRRRTIARKLVGGTRAAPNVRVRQLLNLLPFAQRFGWCNRINWRLGAAMLRREARAMPAPRVLWIYDPRGADAIGSFGEAFAVYDCVDDYQHQVGPGARGRAFVAQQDLAAAAGSRLVFVTTAGLKQRHEGSSGVHLVPNVGDYDHFRPAAARAHARPALRELTRPVIGFAGNIAEGKVDFELLDAVAAGFPDASLLLAGPAEGGARSRLDELGKRHSNLTWLGLQPYADLPSVIAAFDVALIPYAVNPYTRNVFPLKVYEYLAAGKPVVASGVPSVAHLDPHVVLAPDRASFVAAIEAAVAAGEHHAEERMAIAAANTWDGRTGSLLELIRKELAG